ncbi:hypothetical protein A0J51_00993 [Gluconobacter japonicus]|nr:hypothetical protein A0J51_00993 [Gluconobacter japonicus]
MGRKRKLNTSFLLAVQALRNYALFVTIYFVGLCLGLNYRKL